MQDAIRALVDGDGLDGPAAAEALSTIMAGEATPAQIGAFLVGLRARGETPEVVAACIDVMLANAEPVAAGDVLDVCGTGGDGADTFNVSTAAGFVVAAAGGRVAKHGNRAASSRCGSADLLEALGARIDLGGEAVASAIDRCGFAFLFAQRFHPAMRHVGGPRREIGIRTIFNVLGPLSNPARPSRQLVGVGAAGLAPLVAGALRLRGLKRAMVVHSADGLDEISPAASTHAWIIEGDTVHERDLTPDDLGVEPHPLASVAGGSPEQNADALRRVLAGEAGPVADFVAINAGAACYVAGLAGDVEEGTRMAREVLASGTAGELAGGYVALTQELA